MRCYDDVLEFIAERQDEEHRRRIVQAHLKEGIDSAIFKDILKTSLYEYQREGALFAVKAGRCLIGDDMGLGKTVQALAAAELMANWFNIQKVLIISPTSLKYQWRSEIEKFCGRTVDVVEGFNYQREQIYKNESFYKLLNYELVFRDIDFIREWAPDLIILDEAQTHQELEDANRKIYQTAGVPLCDSAHRDSHRKQNRGTSFHNGIYRPPAPWPIVPVCF